MPGMKLYAGYEYYENIFIGFYTYLEQDKSLSRILVDGLVCDGTTDACDVLYRMSGHPDFIKQLKSYGWHRVPCDDRVVDGFEYLAFRFVKSRK